MNKVHNKRFTQGPQNFQDGSIFFTQLFNESHKIDFLN